MPSKKTVAQSPVKSGANEDLLNYPWCVTDRLGLYVQVYNDEEPVGKTANDVLSRIGFINGVSWSGVYSRDGKNVSIFKFEVETKGSSGINQTGEGKNTTYVVTEENFTDFSDDHYQKEYLKAGETGCTNVGQELVDAWCASSRTKNGLWLKKWFNSVRGGDTEASVQTVRTQARMPGVFGDDSNENQNSQATSSNNQDMENENADSSFLPAPAKSPPTNRSGNIYRLCIVLLCCVCV